MRTGRRRAASRYDHVLASRRWPVFTMTLFEFRLPTRVSFGAGSIARLGEAGARAGVLAAAAGIGPGARRSGPRRPGHGAAARGGPRRGGVRRLRRESGHGDGGPRGAVRPGTRPRLGHRPRGRQLARLREGDQSAADERRRHGRLQGVRQCETATVADDRRADNGRDRLGGAELRGDLRCRHTHEDGVRRSEALLRGGRSSIRN